VSLLFSKRETTLRSVSLDLLDRTGGRRNIRKLLGGVNSLALAVEFRVAQPVRVVIASVGVALAGEAVLGVGTAAAGGLADVVLVVRAGVGGEGV